MEKKKTSSRLSYGINDKPRPLTQFILGFQHIFAAFGGIITVPIVIAGALDLDSTTTTLLISAAILAAGIATLIQSKGAGPVGAKVATIMGTDFTFVAPSIAVGSSFGLAGIFGAVILGSFTEVILSFFIRPIMKLFPPVVTGTVVTLIGLTLVPVAIDWAAGGSGAKDYGSFENIAIALVIMIVTLLINHYGKGMLSNCSILIGMIAGYILCVFLGKIDFSTIANASWFAFPNIFAYGVTFKLSAVLAFIPAYIVSIISTVGCLKAVEEVSEVPTSSKRMASGVLADGIGSMIAGVVGAFPNTVFSQNVGLVSLTKVASKYVTIMAGIILVVLGLLPKFAAIIDTIPLPVLGGVGIVMFGTVAAAGIQTLGKVKLSNRNLLIIAVSIAIGLGVTFRPELIDGLPQALKMLFSSGISTGAIVAVILNLILVEKKDKKEIKQEVK